MNRIANAIKGYEGPNPFSDSQGRNFSDQKVSSEFFPISNFWSLFNDQHEVILGTRGSGKTFLLKMMRYSMLKRISDPKAELLVSEKNFLALYVPMHLEFVKSITDQSMPEDKQVLLFQMAFNCLLAKSLISELQAMIEDENDILKKAMITAKITSALHEIWFDEKESEIYDLGELSEKVSRVYYKIDLTEDEFKWVPTAFKRQICSSLLAVKEVVARILEFEEPTWIICIDEAEFLNETLQKCINSIFRSDSNRIALKVATLPYFHTTLDTIERGVTVSAGNDFSYRVVDMTYDSMDFQNLTNKLCAHRLKTRLDVDVSVSGLEDFLGTIGNDDLIDYYRYEVGEDAQPTLIEEQIIESFSEKRRAGASTYPNKRKTIYDKFAPVFFVRQMYALSKEGNRKPGWYAGAGTVRKVSQGNPRVFIQLMSDLFEKAKKAELKPKAQHEVIYEFSQNMCNATKALEAQGPVIYDELERIATILHKRTHEKELVSTSAAFTLTYKSDEAFEQNKRWIQLAVAYLRLIVDDDAKKNGLKKDTKYVISNMYAAAYWIPMRKDGEIVIAAAEKDSDVFKPRIHARKSVLKTTATNEDQMSLFEGEPK